MPAPSRSRTWLLCTAAAAHAPVTSSSERCTWSRACRSPSTRAFSYVPHGTGWTAAGALAPCYDTGVLTTLREDDAAAWRRSLASFSVPAKPAVEWEVAWHGGYLRSMPR